MAFLLFESSPGEWLLQHSSRATYMLAGITVGLR